MRNEKAFSLDNSYELNLKNCLNLLTQILFDNVQACIDDRDLGSLVRHAEKVMKELKGLREEIQGAKEMMKNTKII